MVVADLSEDTNVTVRASNMEGGGLDMTVFEYKVVDQDSQLISFESEEYIVNFFNEELTSKHLFMQNIPKTWFVGNLAPKYSISCPTMEVPPVLLQIENF